MIGLLMWLACASGPRSAIGSGDRARIHVRRGGRVVRVPDVMYRPVDPPGADAQWLVDSVGPAHWDAGLAGAAQDLVGTLRAPGLLLTPRASATATGRNGFPGAARFARTWNDGARPEHLIDGIVNGAAGRWADVALARRQFDDGRTLWVVAWAPHLADMDPVPRQIALDAGLTVRADLVNKTDARMFMSTPDGPVKEVSLTSGVARWVEGFITPGEYRFEVLSQRDGIGEIALLFSVYVDGKPPRIQAPPMVPDEAPDPVEAEVWLFHALNEIRVDHGLAPVRRFALFEGLAREHSAMMGHKGLVAHRLPEHGGVVERAAALAHPRARHYENVAAAPRPQDAMSLVSLSPAHLENFLCTDCTHVAIGAALEPVLDKMPRLFVTWELLSFPQGPPQEIDHYNR